MPKGHLCSRSSSSSWVGKDSMGITDLLLAKALYSEYLSAGVADVEEVGEGMAEDVGARIGPSDSSALLLGDVVGIVAGSCWFDLGELRWATGCSAAGQKSTSVASSVMS